MPERLQAEEKPARLPSRRTIHPPRAMVHGEMRGSVRQPGTLFSYVDLDQRMRADHPLRVIRVIGLIVNEPLGRLIAEFETIYAAGVGRPSIPPERLLRTLLFQAFYGIRSKCRIMERLHHDLLFRWFVGMGIDEPAWDQTTFSKNRDRLLAGDVAHRYLPAVMAHRRAKRLLSTDHLGIDGTMIEAWASMKSFKPKDGVGEPAAPSRNGEVDFHGKSRSNQSHQSTTDPDARLLRKGRGMEAKHCVLGHALMENCRGLVIAALQMIELHADKPGRITLATHEGYDAQDFGNEVRVMSVRRNASVWNLWGAFCAEHGGNDRRLER